MSGKTNPNPSKIERLALAWAKAHTRGMAIILAPDYDVGIARAYWLVEEGARQKLLTACIRSLGRSRKAKR